MGYITLRGQKYEIDNDRRQNLYIPRWNVIIEDCMIGRGVVVWANLNIYGCTIGEETRLANFIEIRHGSIGRRCKIEPFAFLPEGVTIGDGVFIGPNVSFVNDPYPRSCAEDGTPVTQYSIVETRVEDHASIGAGCTIRCGVTIGRNAMIGAGSVVTRDVARDTLWYGPAASLRGTVV